MWKSFTINGTNYILKTYLDEKYKCLLTDLNYFWIEELTKDEIYLRCQVSWTCLRMLAEFF